MALTNSQHDAIMRTYDAIRTENRHIQNERYAQVTAACPEIAQIEDDIIGLSMQAAAEAQAEGKSKNPAAEEQIETVVEAEEHRIEGKSE